MWQNNLISIVKGDPHAKMEFDYSRNGDLGIPIQVRKAKEKGGMVDGKGFVVVYNIGDLKKIRNPGYDVAILVTKKSLVLDAESIDVEVPIRSGVDGSVSKCWVDFPMERYRQGRIMWHNKADIAMFWINYITPKYITPDEYEREMPGLSNACACYNALYLHADNMIVIPVFAISQYLDDTIKPEIFSSMIRSTLCDDPNIPYYSRRDRSLAEFMEGIRLYNLGENRYAAARFRSSLELLIKSKILGPCYHIDSDLPRFNLGEMIGVLLLGKRIKKKGMTYYVDHKKFLEDLPRDEEDETTEFMIRGGFAHFFTQKTDSIFTQRKQIIFC